MGRTNDYCGGDWIFLLFVCTLLDSGGFCTFETHGNANVFLTRHGYCALCLDYDIWPFADTSMIMPRLALMALHFASPAVEFILRGICSCLVSLWESGPLRPLPILHISFSTSDLNCEICGGGHLRRTMRKCRESLGKVILDSHIHRARITALSRTSCSDHQIPNYQLSAPQPPAIATSLPALAACRKNSSVPSAVALPVQGILPSPFSPACIVASSVASLYSSSIHPCFLPTTARLILLFHSL